MIQKHFSFSDRFCFDKFIFTAAIFFGIFLIGNAQDLDYLTPVRNSKIDMDTSSLVIGITDFAKYENKVEPRSYSSSVQIIDADQPWPPRWYKATPVYTAEMFENDKKENKQTLNVIGSPQILGDYFTYGKIVPAPNVDTTKWRESQFVGRCLVLNKQMELVLDNMKSRIFYGGDFNPDFKKHPGIERIMKLNKVGNLDLSRITGEPKDRSVETVYNVIQILDVDDNVKYEWNPMDHIAPEDLKIKDRLSGLSSGHFKYSELNSYCWDFDGNLLYSVEEKGIGKASRVDGHIIWSLDQAKMPVITGKDTLKLFSMRDFHALYENDTAEVYSFYAGKADDSSFAKAVVLERNKTTGAIKIIKFLYPKKKYQLTGYGYFDYNYTSHRYAIDYGVFKEGDYADTDAGYREAFQYGKGDSTYAVYELPKYNYCFGVHFLDSWPRPPRPVIEKNGNSLKAVGELKEWTWYKLEGPFKTVVTKVGTGPGIIPQKGVTYCVVGPYGIGFCASRAYTYMP